MKRMDKLVVMVVLLFLALALLRTTLELAAQFAPWIAAVGALYALARLWSTGKLDFVKTAFVKNTTPTPEPAERK